MKLTIIYDANNGIGYPDGHCENAARSMCALRGKYTFGSQLLFDHIRLLVKKGVLPADELESTYAAILDAQKALEAARDIPAAWSENKLDKLADAVELSIKAIEKLADNIPEDL